MSDKKQILKDLDIGSKQQKNIRLLANFLSKLPLVYSNFDMSRYRCEIELGDRFRSFGDNVPPISLKPVKDPSTLHTCGTSGCAIGHAPMVYGVTKPHKDEDWTDYSYRFLFDLPDAYVASNTQDKVWEWCFSGEWVDNDNTPQGAAKRMMYFLNNPEYVIHEWDVDTFSKNIVDMYSGVVV